MGSGERLEGSTLDGKYRIDQLLGRGGMGAVYRAEHVGTGRPVAVKVLLPRFVGNPGALERFSREARAAGRLRHPNIVDVTDFGIDRNREMPIAYLVMEYLRGATLRAVLERVGALPVGVAVNIVEQIALALDEAHANGIVHRDLKPDNICLISDPRGGYSVRVLDFGIATLRDSIMKEEDGVQPSHDARPIESESAESRAVTVQREPVASEIDPMDADTVVRESSPSAERRLTMAGTTLGTPAYMSPEQCRGEDVDARSDTYSLAVVSWEAMAGRRLFEGSYLELIRKHTSELPPRLDQVRPKVGSTIADALARGLSKEPEERYDSAGAMAGSLRAAFERPNVVLRRALALYSERFSELVPISFRASIPAFVLLAALFLIGGLIGRQWLVIIPAAGSFLVWAIATVRTNAAFAIAVDRLIQKPFEALSTKEVFDLLKNRVGLDAKASEAALFVRVGKTAIEMDRRAPSSVGDLSLLILLHEEIDASAAAERCAILAPRVKHSYRWVGIVAFLLLIVLPALEAAISYSITALVGMPSVNVAILVAVALVPVNTAVFNPILSIAMTLMYFRARQANGERVTIGSITT